MKKYILGLCLASSLSFGADVIPNECAFPAAKPLINAAFSAQAISNAADSAFIAAQATSNNTYALKSGVTRYITNMVSTSSSNILWVVSGVITNFTTIP